MPFFQGARDFDIKGGTFYDVQGNQNNHRNDNSFTLTGTGNTANISPNLSRQDNRTYNMGYSNMGLHGTYSHTHNYGSPAQIDPQDYQMFLAWKQAGSPLAPPTHPPLMSPPSNLQIGQHLMNGLNAPRGIHQDGAPTETHPHPQFSQHYHPANTPQPQPSSVTHDPAQHRPALGSHYVPPHTVWENPQHPGCQQQVAQPAQHPPHHRSQSEPLPGDSPTHPLSEASDILSDPDDANSIPGFAAILSLQDRLAQQVQNPAHPPPRHLSTSAGPTLSHPPGGTDVSPSRRPPQSGLAPDLPPLPTPPANALHPQTRLQSPPPLSATTKPSTLQPPPRSVLDHLPSVVPDIPQQPTPPPDIKWQKTRPSSSSSSSSSSSGGEGRKHSKTSWVNRSLETSSQISNISPVSFPSPSTNRPANTATSPFRHENDPPPSSPAYPKESTSSDASSIPAPISLPVTPPFSAFPTLRPLNASQAVQDNSQGTGTCDIVAASLKKKKKDKTLLQKFGLGRKKTKEGKAT